MENKIKKRSTAAAMLVLLGTIEMPTCSRSNEVRPVVGPRVRSSSSRYCWKGSLGSGFETGKGTNRDAAAVVGSRMRCRDA
jgi:hypothetical protein